jgi:catechol 2,3-dioxygenase-like lactoylglutathione lyase family enzyme
VAVDLFAGLPVADYDRALAWYERLLGSGPSFLPNETEAVWELAEHRYVFIEVRPEHAGHAMHTVFVDDFDARVEQMADRGIEPAERETYSNGVRKATYRDPDGNEIGFGGGPADAWPRLKRLGGERPRRRGTPGQTTAPSSPSSSARSRMRDTSMATPPAMAATPRIRPMSVESRSTPGAATRTTPARTSMTA